MRDVSLLDITVVTDDDVGIYTIGELDFGKSGYCENFLKSPGNRVRFVGWLRWLADAAENGTPPFFQHDGSVTSADGEQADQAGMDRAVQGERK